MGVTYKLRDEVVHFIISQRQNNPLLSCRQLAESASQQFSVRLSKSSVHDVLKESGVATPRGRKPKDKFQIPIEKKKQIQVSLSQVILGKPLKVEDSMSVMATNDSARYESASVSPAQGGEAQPSNDTTNALPGVELPQKDTQVLPEYEGAGKIFLKAALWDLGVFSEEQVQEEDWGYYLIYTSRIKVMLENSSSYVIDWSVPLHRSIRELADSFINNIKPLIVNKLSDENLFKASMESRPGFKITNISLVDEKDHTICEFNNIVDLKRRFMLINRVFVESVDRNLTERAKTLFFSQIIDNNKVMENILNLKGFDSINKDEYIVNILIEENYANKDILQQAIEKLNNMFLRDEQNRLVKGTCVKRL